ncbi:isochorismate synthase [Amnibacterium sp. CER49]|uniref:isochorismate synthase n=1 Tax=Amnibacterium sp. CER49 TaxID=3039161 RepID=UPI002449E198|nr:isochorismate synthase [Amnibacterium sp. CER49]MDH2443406.1 isochorismate synthase [Amnibacterium sp. CER49]
MTVGAGAAFTVATRTYPANGGAAEALGAEAGPPVTAWARGDDRLLGYGVAARIVLSGPSRFADAATAWRRLLEGARIADEVGLPGSGPVAFGAFAFDDASAAPSVLVVPRRIVGRRDGVGFVTDVTGTGPIATAAVPAQGPGTRFADEDYVAAVAAAVERIRAGGLQKVVLARDLALAPAEVDPAAWLRALRARHRDAFTFAVDGFFGASPETLATVRDGVFTARVLAGTAARDADPALDAAARGGLLGSAKNRFEHALAVDSLLLTLGERVDDLRIGRPFALGLPNVWHLATDAEARLHAGTGVLDLVAALHPTAAVAGAPRADAIELIRSLEPFDRGRYAGPVGWVGASGEGEWAIGLRSAQVEPGGVVRAFAGAGIVAASEARSELAETAWKLTPVLEALGEQPLLPTGAPRAGSAALPAR